MSALARLRAAMMCKACALPNCECESGEARVRVADLRKLLAVAEAGKKATKAFGRHWERDDVPLPAEEMTELQAALRAAEDPR